MTDVQIPEDKKPSRLNKKPRPDVNPDDLATADAKILAFRLDNPRGVIKTEITESKGEVGETRWVVRASVWRDWQINKQPDATAHAACEDGMGDGYEADYPLETAETRSVARALRYLGIGHRVEPLEEP